MKFSYKWIQRHIEETLPEPKALQETIIFHAFEVESVEKIADDFVFDIKVLPDRAGDCFSHYGMAREIAGLLGLTLKKSILAALPQVPLDLSVDIKSTLCNRYIAIKIDGVKVSESPAWLKDALESVGQRSINNVVDATNYVVQDIGQPVHAFDAAKIDGGIVVRPAHENETIITLSGEDKKLNPDMLVIADYLGVLAIAGVKGGKSAEVSDETTSVIIEVANFDAISIRKTSRRLNLITDASKRFENTYSPEFASIAAAQFTALITDIAGGIVTGVSDTYPVPAVPRTLVFTVSDIVRVLGGSVTADAIEQVLRAYGYTYARDDETFTWTVPYWRNDIRGPHDIAEEIGRVIGYDTIAPRTLPFVPVIEDNAVDMQIRAIKSHLFAQGFREVMNYSFTKKGEVYVAYGSKDKSALRTNLSDALKESYERNRLNAPLLHATSVKLFEIGTVFFADREELRVATVENALIEELPIGAYAEKYAINLQTTAIPAPDSPIVPFTAWSPYPFITRDIAVWTDSTDIPLLEEIVRAFAAERCAVPALLFDSFAKDGRTSVAYRLVFQSDEKTLTDEEVEHQFLILTHRIVAEKVFEIR